MTTAAKKLLSQVAHQVAQDGKPDRASLAIQCRPGISSRAYQAAVAKGLSLKKQLAQGKTYGEVVFTSPVATPPAIATPVEAMATPLEERAAAALKAAGMLPNGDMADRQIKMVVGLVQEVCWAGFDYWQKQTTAGPALQEVVREAAAGDGPIRVTVRPLDNTQDLWRHCEAYGGVTGIVESEDDLDGAMSAYIIDTRRSRLQAIASDALLQVLEVKDNAR